MAVRLGTQNWINPGPHAAAADMVAEAGRATGAGIASLGAGIGQGMLNFSAKQEREVRRQDLLNQQGIENSRADRMEADHKVKGQIALQSDLVNMDMAAWKMSVEMFNDDPSPENEERVKRAEQKLSMSRSGYATLASKQTGQPTGVASSGMMVNGRPMSALSDAELDDLRAKSEAGEVDISYTGSAPGNAHPVARPASLAMPEPPALTGDDFVDAETRASYYEGMLKMALAASLSPAKSKYEQRAAAALSLKLQPKAAASRALATSEKGKREQAEKETAMRAKAEFEGQQANAALRRLPNPETGKPYIAEGAPDLPPAAAVLTLNKIVMQNERSADAMAKQDDAQAFKAGQAKDREVAKERRDMRLRGWQMDDREFKAGQMDKRAYEQSLDRGVDDARADLALAMRRESDLQDLFRANKATDAELADAKSDVLAAEESLVAARNRKNTVGPAAPVPTKTATGTADLVDEVFK